MIEKEFVLNIIPTAFLKEELLFIQGVGNPQWFFVIDAEKKLIIAGGDTERKAWINAKLALNDKSDFIHFMMDKIKNNLTQQNIKLG